MPRVMREDPAFKSFKPPDFETEYIDIAIRFMTFNTQREEHKMMLKQKGWGTELQQYEGLTMMRDAIVKVCGDVKVEGFLWKDI